MNAAAEEVNGKKHGEKLGAVQGFLRQRSRPLWIDSEGEHELVRAVTEYFHLPASRILRYLGA